MRVSWKGEENNEFATIESDFGGIFSETCVVRQKNGCRITMAMREWLLIEKAKSTLFLIFELSV